jgi:transaldolase
MGESDPARQLHELGQSPWLDSLSRQMLGSGAPARYVKDVVVSGLSSNPSILGHAMVTSKGYDGEQDRWQLLAAAGAQPQRVLLASTLSKAPALPDTYYLGRLAVPDTIDSVLGKTLLAFADHGSLDDRLASDAAGAERAIGEVAEEGIVADALAERLQHQGASAFLADWSDLLEGMTRKASRSRSRASTGTGRRTPKEA